MERLRPRARDLPARVAAAWLSLLQRLFRRPWRAGPAPVDRRGAFHWSVAVPECAGASGLRCCWLLAAEKHHVPAREPNRLGRRSVGVGPGCRSGCDADAIAAFALRPVERGVGIADEGGGGDAVDGTRSDASG